MLKELEFAIEDCRRMIGRTESYVEKAKSEPLTDADLRNIRRHSLDVTHSLVDLRKAIESTSATVQPADAAV